MRVEETDLDVLQNIEFAIANEYRLNPALQDRDALDAVQGLIRQYAAEERKQRHVPSVYLGSSSRAVFDSVKTMCEFRLGRTVDSPMAPIDHRELLSCLKRIRESIQHWTREDGARGYLKFIMPMLLYDMSFEDALIEDDTTETRHADSIPRDVWGRLYDLSVRVWKLAPWSWMSEHDVFGVQMPASGETIFISITGMAGQYFAIIVYPNADAIRTLWSLEDDAPPERILDISQIHASFGSRGELEQDERRLIEDLGFRFKGQAWPMFRSYRPGFAPWSIEPGEAEMLIAAMEQVLEMAPRVRADPELLVPEDTESVLVRVSSGNGSVSWKDEIREIGPLTASRVFTELNADSVDSCRRARPFQNEFEVDLFPLKTAVCEGGGRPRTPYVLLMVDSETGFVVAHEMLIVETSLGDMWARVPGLIVEKLRHLGVRPRSLVVRGGPIAAVVQAVAEVLGLQVRVDGNLSSLDSAKSDLSRHMTL